MESAHRLGRPVALGLALATMLVACPCAAALDPALDVSQYGHKAWRLRDGYFSSPVTAITQTNDGYIWIGTQSGLIRFDGVKFEPWHPPKQMPLPSERIFGLFGARDGGLWIGTDDGLAEWKDGKLTVFAKVGRFGAILQDHNGTIWAGHTRAVAQLPPLCRASGGEFRCFGRSDGLPFLWVGSLLEDSQGTLWVGGDGGICGWKSNQASCVPIPGLERFADKFGVMAASSDSTGTLWAGAGAMGIQQLVSGKWRHFTSRPASPDAESESMLYDRHGNFWIGTRRQGLLRIKPGQVEAFGTADGLSGDYVTRIFEDHEDNLWVGTSSGLDCFHDVRVTTLTKREGLLEDWVVSIAASHNGGVWMASHSGLLRLKDNHFSYYRGADALPGSQPTSVLEDSKGRLWLGIDDGIAWLEGGKFSRLRAPDGSPIGVVRAIVEDRDGCLWMCTTNAKHALLRVKNEKVDQVFPSERFGGKNINALSADPKGGLWLALSLAGMAHFDGNSLTQMQGIGRVRDFFIDSDGLWAATSDGLVLLKEQQPIFLTVQNGLPCNDIEGAIKGNDDSLWLKTACGLIRVAAAELRKWKNEPQSQVQMRVYDALDGAQSGISPFTPRVAKSTDGLLWFTLEGGGIQVVDPERLKSNAIVPPVHILQVLANHKAHDSGGVVRLPPLTKDLEIDYTALSFVIPEKVRFRYKLEGTDSDWQDAGTRRQAFYTNLKPGKYRFHVIACNNDGVWNEEGAFLDFSVVPAFYQTNWFSVLCMAALLALLWALYQYRLHQIHRQLKIGFEARVSERLRIARELHDTLLQSFHGILLRFQTVSNDLPESKTKQKLDSAIDLAHRAITEGRDAVQGLRSSTTDTNELALAVGALGKELAGNDTNQNSPVFRVDMEGEPRDLHPLLRDEVYRIAGEALRNAFRHAQARRIEVEIHYDPGDLRLRIRDDGKGIAPEIVEHDGPKGHWGLHGMRERARIIGGKLEVWSSAQSGTEIELAIPARVAYAAAAGQRRSWFSRKAPAAKS